MMTTEERAKLRSLHVGHLESSDSKQWCRYDGEIMPCAMTRALDDLDSLYGIRQQYPLQWIEGLTAQDYRTFDEKLRADTAERQRRLDAELSPKPPRITEEEADDFPDSPSVDSPAAFLGGVFAGAVDVFLLTVFWPLGVLALLATIAGMVMLFRMSHAKRYYAEQRRVVENRWPPGRVDRPFTGEPF